MYSAQTRSSQAVQVEDAVDTGRILVVDDDRAFGGFMLAALEARGHCVEWAGSIHDALGALYAACFDLVIIDLRLPDGSGITFLRDATDEGLLADSAAIILTGHDFEEPADIRVYRKGDDLETFLDRAGTIIAQAKRRRELPRRQTHTIRSRAENTPHPAKRIKIELVLYTSPESDKCQKAMRTIRSVLEEYDTSQVSFTVCDLSRPENVDGDAVLFTPTLVKRAPGPRTWIVGNLDHPSLLTDLLDVSGVQRKRD